MINWPSGFGEKRPTGAKIPVKLHRNVSLIRTADAILADELLARSRLSGWIVGRLTQTVLLVQPGAVSEVVAELRRLGHTPQVVGGK
jgi:hypothetical protein